MTNRIPMHPELQYPFRADDDSDGNEVLAANGNFVGFRKEWLAAVLNDYYTDSQPQQPQPVPQFVVVNWNDGDEENEMGVATCDISEIGDVVRLRNGREIPIVEAEYDRLKSILAPGQ